MLSDGGHVSRNPQVVIDLLLDLLPLKLAFLWRRIQTPQPIVAAIDRMMPMLRMMRHADGSIALFNGMGATRADLLAAVLAQDDAVAPPPLNAPYAGYQRLDRGGAVLIADTAPAPRPPLASRPMRAPAPSSSRPRAPASSSTAARRRPTGRSSPPSPASPRPTRPSPWRTRASAASSARG